MGRVKQITDQMDLVIAIRGNDNEVLKKLYCDNYRKVETYILKNNGSIPQAKDTYQEAFIVMYQNIKSDKFQPENETAVQGYLYSIARNKWTDFLRSNRNKKTYRLDSTLAVKGSDEVNSEEACNSEIDTYEMAMQAFKQLGAECKKLLEVFYFQKKPLREIAAIFNIGEASCRNKKYRCIQQLRKLIISAK